MKFFNSIRWRLQLWYGLILVLVLAGLGTAAYQLERGKMFRQVDGDLVRRLNVIAGALHNSQGRPPPHLREGEGDFGPPNGPQNGPPDGGPEGPGGPDGPGGPPEDRPNRPSDNFGDHSRQRQEIMQQRLRSFSIPVRDQYLFDTTDTNGFYYVIIGSDQETIRSTNAPEQNQIIQALPSRSHHEKLATGTPGSEPPTRPDDNSPQPEPGVPDRISDREPTTWTRSDYRESYMFLPFPGEQILVGRNIKPELAELHVIGFQLAGIGGIILLVGLAGGWWFVTQAIKPVEMISATAARISGGDLSQRINVAETESELGRLAAVLNSTFARLETAFAQQKQFAADAAHELRTPVTVILTQTQLSLNRERTAEDYKQTVIACQRAAQRMRRLIESLLELTRFDAGQEVLKRLPFDLAGTVNESVDLVKTLADERGVTVSVEVSPLAMTGDSERLGQVVMNLLTNAIQYNRSGGAVQVTLTRDGDLAVLTVTDTGKGIAAEDLPRVFERFYRADQSRTGSGNSGLGLSICQAIVEAHSGTLEAASEPGTGSRFTLRLPV